MDKRSDKITVSEDVLFWAFRYCITRSTYAASDGVKAIRDNWNSLSNNMKMRIQEEIRTHNWLMQHNVDKSMWESLLSLPIKNMDKMVEYPINRVDGKVGIE
jgi:hypothetical protein